MRRRRLFLDVLIGLWLVAATCPHAGAQPSSEPPPSVVNSELDAMVYGPPPSPTAPPPSQPKYAPPTYTPQTYAPQPSAPPPPAPPTYRRAPPPVYHVAPKPRVVPAYAPPPVVHSPCSPPAHSSCAPATAYPGNSYVAVMAEPAGYTLDSGDKLRVVVFGQDTLSNTYTVDAAGLVTMPLIGAVPARGLTTQQLSGAISGRLKANFLRDPSVAVEIDTYRPFFVLGEVTYPGQYPYVPHITVEKAVAIAGGFTPRASKDTVNVTRKYQGVPGRIKLPMQAPILPGDAITVGERWF